MTAKRFRGMFPVLQTPFDEQGELDTASMERQVRFAIEGGAGGLVYPVLGGEVQFLSDRERQQMVEVVVGTAAHQIPVVAGVAAPSAPIAREHALHAARVGADAVIALPPYIGQGTQDEILAYYRVIAAAAQRPVFVQHTGPGMSPAFMVRVMREVEHVHYIKEEAPPSGHNISAVLEAVGEECWGVFGGAHGRWMIAEMRRGACGFMPATQTTDIEAKIWNAYQAGDEAEARSLFARITPLINLITLVGLAVCKEVLVRRGVIRTAYVRAPGRTDLDATDRYELDVIYKDLEPLFGA